MHCIKSIRIIDFLEENGCYPVYEDCGHAFYRTSARLSELLDRYYIIYYCIPNRRG